MCKCIHNHKIDVLYGFEKIFENNMLTRSTKKIFIPMRNTGILGGGPFGHQTTGRRAVPLRRRTFGRRLVRLVLAPDSPCAQMYGAQMAAPNRRRPNVPDAVFYGSIDYILRDLYNIYSCERPKPFDGILGRTVV